MAKAQTTDPKPRKHFQIREAAISGALVKRINGLADTLGDLPVDEFPLAPGLVKRLRDFAVSPTASEEMSQEA